MKRWLPILILLSLPCWATCSNTAVGAFTCVSTCTNDNFGGTSITCALGTFTNGNVVIGVAGSTAAGSISVSGCTGMTWTTDTTVDTASTMFTGVGGTTGTCTLTATTGSGSESVIATQWSGTSGIDVRGVMSLGAFGKSLSCPAITTTNSGDLIVCNMFNDDASGGTMTAGSCGSTCTVMNQSANFGLGVEAGVQTSSGAITATATWSVSVNYARGVVSLIASGGGGPAPCQSRALMGVGC